MSERLAPPAPLGLQDADFWTQSHQHRPRSPPNSRYLGNGAAPLWPELSIDLEAALIRQQVRLLQLIRLREEEKKLALFRLSDV